MRFQMLFLKWNLKISCDETREPSKNLEYILGLGANFIYDSLKIVLIYQSRNQFWLNQIRQIHDEQNFINSRQFIAQSLLSKQSDPDGSNFEQQFFTFFLGEKKIVKESNENFCLKRVPLLGHFVIDFKRLNVEFFIDIRIFGILMTYSGCKLVKHTS